MKKTLSVIVAALGAATLAGPAGAQQVYGDVAKVLSSTPIYERVFAPRRDCTVEPVTRYEERHIVRPGEEVPVAGEPTGAGTVIGAIIGGVIGHQFGNSSGGRDRGTAAGAIVGGLIGNQIERDAASGYAPASREVIVERTPVTREVERCNTIADTRERLVGYDVRYEYNGREFRARLPYEPGDQIPVNVEVRPPTARPGPSTPHYRGPY